MRLSHLVVIMLAGFAGSFHCIGMCGGFACGLGADPTNSYGRTVLRHVLYNSGRVVSYIFIGALAGVLGSMIIGSGVEHASPHASMTGDAANAGMKHDLAMTGMEHSKSGMVMKGGLGVLQRVLAVVAGLLILVMALQLLGGLNRTHRSKQYFGDSPFSVAMRSLLKSKNPGAPVTLGVVNGFLPCPLVYAFAAVAAASGSVVSGMLTMAALGLGTFPAMFFMGSTRYMFAAGIRRNGAKFAGGFVFLIGIVTVVRGVAPSLLHFSWHGV